MKRILIILCIFCVFININAQRDTDHWFAPMVGSFSNGNPKQALYLSTDSTVPFPVTIYNNNVVIGTVIISKGNPQTFDVTLNFMMGQNASDAMSIKTRGLYLHGDLPFFASYRFSETNHGEILTSKGKAGIGTKFYAVYAPLMVIGAQPPQTTLQSTENFTCGILATEDNTVVKVSGYQMQTWFVNNFNGLTQPTITFTLNKGQSYVFSGSATKPGNKDGFIGAKIEATKPVSVTNGNFHGQFGTVPPYNGEDIIMDQSVPVERLGDEFVLVRGMGDLLGDIEGAIVVATENNTEVRINGNPLPVATLNEGQYYRVSVMSYIQNGPGHFNMHIKTSKNAYVYQLLSGIANNDATEGFNYMPPLNCFLPKKIDEIGMIGELPYATVFNPPLVVKMNILTQTGATVLVNGGTPTAAQGPFPVTGTTNWVTYSIPNVTGNITVESTKPVTAGIVGGSGNLGYGGYFAGANNVPVITKVGTCVPGTTLFVEGGFASYQWNLNGNPIPGATSNTYVPTTGGSYTVTISTGGCSPLTTYSFKVYSCLATTTKSLNLCSNTVVTTITPAFTNSAQTPLSNSVQIITSPTNGTLTLNSSTGQLTYTPNAGMTTDTFVYKFCGNDPDFPDCEQVTVNVALQPLVLQPATIKACNVNGQGTFDLTSANVGGAPTVIKKYYPTLADLNAGTNEILNINNYVSAVPATIHVKVTTVDGCTDHTTITLQYYPAVDVHEATLAGCALEQDQTKGSFDLTTASVTSTIGATKRYFPTLNDAINSTNEIFNFTNYISGTTEIYVKVTSNDGCSDFAKVKLEVTPPHYSSVLADKQICPDATTTLDAGPGFTGYLWSTGATTQTIQNVPVGDYWVILSTRDCRVKQKVKVTAASLPIIKKIEIKNNTATITAEGGNPPYSYSNDNISWQNSNVFENILKGKNFFYVRDAYNCAAIEAVATNVNLINTITPNSDGRNDVLDYSELADFKDFSFMIFDRYGRKIFETKNNVYKWDGKVGQFPVPSDTYWYKLEWIEDGKQILYSGWILVKNRD